MQGEEPLALLTVGLGLGGSAGDEVSGQSREVGLVIHIELKSVVLVEDVVAEGDAQRGELLVYFTQAGLLLVVEVSS